MRFYRPFVCGQKIGRLTLVFSFYKRMKGRNILYWNCTCRCGGRNIVRNSNLRCGAVRSCGCLAKDVARATHLIHGESKKKPEWLAWKNMIDRCENENHFAYKNYGGRGVKVFKGWRRSYQTFLAAVGRRPSPKHSLNRIDNEKGYFPGNVNWITSKEQSRNRRSTLMLEIDGVKRSMTEWVSSSNIKLQTFYGRLRRGWSPKEALETPIHREISRNTRKMYADRKIKGHSMVVTVDGVSKTVSEWVSLSDIKASTFRARLRAGWSPKEALETPVHPEISRASKAAQLKRKKEILA